MSCAMVGSYGSASSMCSQFAIIPQIPAMPCPGEGPLQGKGGEGALGHTAHRLTHSLCMSLNTNGKLRFGNLN